MSGSEIVGAVILFGIIIVIAESVLRLLGYRLKQWRDRTQDQLGETEEFETVSLQYFRKTQRLAIARFWIYIALAVFASLLYDIHTFSYLALVAGGLLIIFKESVVSFFSYFSITSRYEIGDDVRIKDALGEIIRIRPLSVSFMGKEESGDYNGKLIVIPNYLFVTEIVERQELKRNNYRMIKLVAIYDRSMFSISFEKFFTQLKSFLDENLPKRNSLQVGHYKTFAGHRYKLTYDYNEIGNVLVTVRFISSPARASEYKELIISFIESLRA